MTETSGAFEITGVGDGGTVYCKKAGTTYGYGVGFGGPLAAITGGKATYDALFSNVYINSSYKFSGTKVTGKMLFGVPILDTTKVAEACPTKPQTFTATLSAPAAPVARGAYAWPAYTR